MKSERSPLLELLGCDYPVVLAGMGGVARSELVAAVVSAGGFGFLGMVRESPDLIRCQIADVRSRTDRPFGVNLIPAATPPALLEAELEACIEAKVRAVTLFWDLAPDVVSRLRNAGIVVVCQVGSVAEAKAAEEAGCDVVIAQGLEAGGHVRGRTGLSNLVADVIRAVGCPVLAAGGIVDGAGLATALLSGAQGAVLGTAFLATEESFAHQVHKQRIVDAGPDETVHTTLFPINWPAGAAVRVLPNAVTRGERGEANLADKKVIGHDGARPIFLFSTDSPLRSMTGELEAMAIYAGEGASRIADIIPAGERLRQIVAEARTLLGQSGTSLLPAHPTPVTIP
jgi:nitronate monooxygenase